MPRRARRRFADVPLHIIQRGNNRIACFFAEQDYRFYLKEIRNAANGGFALGNQRFKDEISAMLGRRVERLRQRLRQRASQSG